MNEHEPQWAIVIQPAGRDTPLVMGPYASEADARYAEDRHTDAPAGAMAYIVPMWAPADVEALTSAD